MREQINRAIVWGIVLCCGLSSAVLGEVKVEGMPWIDMDRGPYFTASVESSIPEPSMTPKGLIIRVNAAKPAYVLFDTDLLRYSCGWTSGPIDFHNVLFDGSHRSWPKVVGEQVFGTRMIPGWAHLGSFDDPRQRFASTDYHPEPENWKNRAYGPLPHDWAQYKGLYVHEKQAVLSYAVHGTPVLDCPGLKPVMQMKIEMQLKSKAGKELNWVIHNTINQVPKE